MQQLAMTAGGVGVEPLLSGPNAPKLDHSPCRASLGSGGIVTELFERGRFASATLIEGAVHRTPGPGAHSVHRLLDHFQLVGTSLTPRVLGSPVDRTEILSFVPGETGYPPYSDEIRSDEALVSVARSIREIHDASVTFEARPDDRWHAMESTTPIRVECIGHGDLTPWNIVFRGHDVVGIIDWDTARPMSRVWDLAYAAYHFAPLHPVADLSHWGWEKEPDVPARLDLFLSAYGTDISRDELISTAVIRLLSMADYIDAQVMAQHPSFSVHAEEHHSAGYRAAGLDLLHRWRLGALSSRD